jgi:hypothetical protein
MSTDCDLIFDVVFMTGMTIVAGANFWLLYRGYRRCMKHLEDLESPALVRQDIANITFDAMMAVAWGIFVGLKHRQCRQRTPLVPADFLYLPVGLHRLPCFAADGSAAIRRAADLVNC